MGGRSWTTDEIARLRDEAGSMPVSSIAAAHGRTEAACSRMIARLGLSQRWHRPTLVECPECHEMRTRVTTGLCPVCSRKETAARLRAREDALLDALGRDAVAARRESTHGSRVDPRPRRRPLARGLPWAVAEDAEARARALQEWEVRQLDRANAAARRRCNRLEAKLRAATGQGQNPR